MMKLLNSLRIARIAVFTTMSVIGAFIKFPSPIGTIAFDSCPGYFSTLAFGYFEGVLVAGMGHIVTSMNVGFPLGILHVAIALFMMLVMVLFRFTYDYFPVKHGDLNLIVSVIIAATLNGFGALIFSPILGWSFALMITPTLMLASYVNAIIASIIFRFVKGVL